jgi:hypothetical protein
MQTTGYIKINNETILILVRQKKYSRLLKIRNTGQKGCHFVDEELHLKGHINKLKALKYGKTIEL